MCSVLVLHCLPFSVWTTQPNGNHFTSQANSFPFNRCLYIVLPVVLPNLQLFRHFVRTNTATHRSIALTGTLLCRTNNKPYAGIAFCTHQHEQSRNSSPGIKHTVRQPFIGSFSISPKVHYLLYCMCLICLETL